MASRSEIEYWLSRDPTFSAADPFMAARDLHFLLEIPDRGEATSAREKSQPSASLSTQDSRALRIRLASYLVAADLCSDAIEEMVKLVDAEAQVEIAALWWLANTRVAEQRPESPWPPEGPLAEHVSPIVLDWTTAHVMLERGNPTSDIDAILRRLEAQCEAGEHPSEFDRAFATVLANLRIVGEAPEPSWMAQAFGASYRYRLGAFEEAGEQYRELASRARSFYPLLTLSAREAETAILSLIDPGDRPKPAVGPDARGELDELSKEAALVALRRQQKLATLYRRLASVELPRDRRDIYEMAARLASLQFGDRLAGALKEALGEAAAAGRALCRAGAYAVGLDFLLDTLQPNIVERELNQLAGPLPDHERVEILERWRGRRNVRGYEGTYGALARLTAPLLRDEDAEDWRRLHVLVESGRPGFTANIDQARTAAKSLAARATVADGVLGRKNLDLLATIAIDPEHLGLYRNDCAGYLTRYLETWFEPDDLETEWFLALGTRIAQSLMGRAKKGASPQSLWPFNCWSSLLVFLGQVIWALRQVGQRADELRTLTQELVELPDTELSTNKDAEIDTLWMGLVFGLLEGSRRTVGLKRCAALMQARLELARSSGRPHQSIGVPHARQDLVQCMQAALLDGNRTQRILAHDTLTLYARDNYLSDLHRLTAIHSLTVAAREHPRRHRAFRKQWVTLAVDAIHEAVRGKEAPFLGETRPGALHISALGLLTSCLSSAIKEQAVQAYEQMENIRPMLLPIEAAGYCEHIGSLTSRLDARRRVRLMVYLFGETTHTDPPRAAAAWVGLVKSHRWLPRAYQGEIERELVRAVRFSNRGYPFRQRLLRGLADQAEVGRLSLAPSTCDELVGMTRDDAFHPVRYHAHRLERYLSGPKQQAK